MKNIKYFIIAILFFGIGSCEYLDYNEEDFFSEEEEVFADFSRIKSYLSGIYNMLPDGFNNVGGAIFISVGKLVSSRVESEDGECFSKAVGDRIWG